MLLSTYYKSHLGLWRILTGLCIVQVASMHAELSQKVVLVPTAPTSLNASLALGAIGIMVMPPTSHPCQHSQDAKYDVRMMLSKPHMAVRSS